ncbi:MAG: TIM barrel protein, partial [Lachnospiraceae bacterium]|nr:TIM barrel protein [Lachnospiraceae bacterium]
MKISFSTIATPDFDWVDIYSMAKDLGFDGIEIRGIGDEISAVNAKVFSASKIDATIKKLKELRLEIPCLDTGCALKEAENREACIKEVTDYMTLADKLGTPYIRLLADKDPEPIADVDDEYVAGVLKELASHAEKYDNITLLVETNGVYSDTMRLKRLIDKVGSPKVAVLWDIHHPYRYMEESPEETVKNIGQYIKHVHVKDSLMVDGKPKYKLMGQGDMPLKSIFASLAEIGYSGYASLEWVKRWDKGLQNAAIAFPHFAHYMSVYRQEKQELLQDNKTHTGKYVWPKEHLIDETFPDVLDRMCKEFPDQYAFRYTELDYTRTYIEFRNDVDTFARSLIAMGVRRGDHVAIWAT